MTTIFEAITEKSYGAIVKALQSGTDINHSNEDDLTRMRLKNSGWM